MNDEIVVLWLALSHSERQVENLSPMRFKYQPLLMAKPVHHPTSQLSLVTNRNLVM